MAPLIFFARAAPARIIAAGLGPTMNCGVGIMNYSVRRRGRRSGDGDFENPVDDFAVNGGNQPFKHGEGLGFVLYQRIPLGVTPQTDALAQIVNGFQVLHPEGVKNPQHFLMLNEAH
jgi:hypothetical protein